MLNVRTVNIESEDKGSDGTGDDLLGIESFIKILLYIYIRGNAGGQ